MALPFLKWAATTLHSVPAGTLAILLGPNAHRFPASLSPSI